MSVPLCQHREGGLCSALMGAEAACEGCPRYYPSVLDTLSAEGWNKVRRRAEDRLRKSPASLEAVACLLIHYGDIRIDDLEEN